MGLFEDIVNWIITYVITPTVTAIHSWVTGLFVSIKNFWSWVLSAVVDWWNTNIAATWNWIISTIARIGNWIDTTYNSLSKWWNSTLSNLMSWIQTITGDIQKSLSDWISGIYDALSSWISEVTAWTFTELGKLAVSINESAGNIWSKLNEIDKALDDVMAGAAGDISGLINGAVNTLKTWVEGFVASAFEAVSSSFFTGLNKGIAEGGHSPLDAEKETDNEILQGLQKYMIKYREDKEKKKVK